MSETQGINSERRQLFKGGMIMAAGLGASIALPATANCESVPVSFDDIVDVVVVGSGFAGMAAALQAREAGVSVMVIDKMPVFGGNSTINGGAMAVAGSALQKQAGIEDSVDAMVADMLRAGRGMNDVEMLKLVCNGTAESCQWLIDYGVNWKPFVQHFGGHSVQRVLQTVESSGAGIIRPLIKAARDKGVIMKNQTKLEGFVQDEAGRVIGVEVREGFYFPNERTGKIRRIGTRRGVIMATGGFGRDIEYRMMQLPELNSDLDSTNHAGATAEALKQMMLIGANPIHLDQIQLGPWASPDEKGFGTASQFNTIATYPHGIVVDVRTGERFFNELADRKARADAIMTRRDEKGQPVYPIGFTNAAGASKAQTLDWGLKYKVISKAETLDELAAIYGMPAKALKAQVERWNEAVKSGIDKEFDRPMQEAIVLDQGPWYAVRMWPKVHYCMGGVKVNTQSEVLHLVSNKAIPGLYAAGEATGGIHGASRLGACAVAEGVVTGRNAGRNCAAAKPTELKQS